MSRPSRAEAEKAVTTLLKWIGENPNREGLRDTPKRVVKAFEEYAAGYALRPEDVLNSAFAERGGYDGPVLVKNITVHSRCEHHLAPFVGRAHVCYIPNKKTAGLSKLARVVQIFSRRLQTQERLTAQISQAINKNLKPKGVAVYIEAEHFCMKLRGAEEEHAMTVTTSFLGAYKEDDDLREEFLASLRL